MTDDVGGSWRDVYRRMGCDPDGHEEPQPQRDTDAAEDGRQTHMSEFRRSTLGVDRSTLGVTTSPPSRVSVLEGWSTRSTLKPNLSRSKEEEEKAESCKCTGNPRLRVDRVDHPPENQQTGSGSGWSPPGLTGQPSRCRISEVIK